MATATVSPIAMEINEATGAVAPEPEVMDEFGRTEAERTVVLSSKDAEAIDGEVGLGKHQTYDDALAYVLQRGFAEIERTRKAARERAQEVANKKIRESYAAVLGSNPALITNVDFVTKMLAEMRVIASKK